MFDSVSLLGAPSIPALGVFQRLSKGNSSQALARFQNRPDIKREIDFFKQEIAKLKTPEDLFKNYRLMKFVLSAYGLESDLNYMGRVKAVMNSDLNDPNSLANRMRDARYRELATDFKMAEFGVSRIKVQSVMDSVIQRYVVTEYEKDQGKLNPALREALYFARNIGKVSTVYEILGDPVLRKVVTETLGLPQQIAVQTVERQAELVSRGIDIAKFRKDAGGTSSVSEARLADARSDVNEIGKLLELADGAANAARETAKRLQDIKAGYDRLASLQSPTGPYADEIPIQQAAVPELVRLQGIIAKGANAAEKMAVSVNRMFELQRLASDPANSASFDDYKAEFAALAQSINDQIDTGADYYFNGTEHNLLDGSTGGPITVTINAAGDKLTINPHDLSGFRDQISAAAAAFAAATSPSDSANLSAAGSALQAAGPLLGEARDTMARNKTEFAEKIATVKTFALTLDSNSLGTGWLSVRDADSRLQQITTKLEELRAIAAESERRLIDADRSDLQARYTDLVAEIDTLINSAAAGADNLLASGTDRTYNLDGTTTMTAQGHDLRSIATVLSSHDVNSAAAARDVLAALDGTIGSSLEGVREELTTDLVVFRQASTVYDPRGKVDEDFRKLAEDLPGLVDGAKQLAYVDADGNKVYRNLLDPTAGDARGFSKLLSEVIIVPAQRDWNSSVTDVVIAAAAQIPSNLFGTGGAYEKLQAALFAANKSAMALEPVRTKARNTVAEAQRVIQQDSSTSTSDASGMTEYTRQFILRYLGLKDAQSLTGAGNPLLDLLTPIGSGNFNLLI
ncbi:MAG TPA: DUF1217 domain-containing protein [Alphaproteobacteria bacterium]